MGVFDFLFKKKDSQVKFKEVREIDIDTLKEILTEHKEIMLKEIYPEAEHLSKQIMKEIDKIKIIVEGIAGKRLDNKLIGYQFVVRMHKNFVKEVSNTLKELKFPDKIDYDSLFEFYTKLMLILKKVTKVASSNRYLYHLFDQEMQTFSNQMKETIKLAENLGEKLNSNKEQINKIGEISNLLNEIHKTRSIMVHDKKTKEDAEMEINDLKRELSEIEIKIKREKFDEKKRELEEIDFEIGNLKAELANCLYPLERPLRKMQKLSLDKTEIRIINEYLEDPINTVFKGIGEGDSSKLKNILNELKNNLLNGELISKEKAREKIIRNINRIINGSLLDDMRKLKELRKREEEHKNGIKDLFTLNQMTAEINQKIKQANEKINKLKEKGEELKEEMKKIVDEIQNKAKIILPYEIKLIDIIEID